MLDVSVTSAFTKFKTESLSAVFVVNVPVTLINLNSLPSVFDLDSLVVLWPCDHNISPVAPLFNCTSL